jgi:recombination protein RecA
MALQARLMSQALRKLSHSLSMSQTLLLFINQVTEVLLKLMESDKGRTGQ